MFKTTQRPCLHSNLLKQLALHFCVIMVFSLTSPWLMAKTEHTARQQEKGIPTIQKKEAWQSIEFSLPTQDGKTVLTGEIDLPQDFVWSKSQAPRERLPAVVLFQGTGLFDRDANFGTTGTARDGIFRVLAEALTQKGMAVVRADYRGVRRPLEISPKTDEVIPASRLSPEAMKTFYRCCVDAKIRATVTPETMQQDLATLFNYAQQRDYINPRQIAVFAHSEGSLHTANLVDRKRITPAAVFVMGGITEAVHDLFIRRQVDPAFSYLASLDGNHDGILTEAELPAASIEILRNPDYPCHAQKEWPLTQLPACLAAGKRKADARVLQLPGDTPWPNAELTQASMAWWQMFFRDSPSNLSLLKNFQGPVFWYWGDADPLAPPTTQANSLYKMTSNLRTKHHWRVFPGLGHSLGPDPIYGPMDETALEVVVQDITKILQAPRFKKSSLANQKGGSSQ